MSAVEFIGYTDIENATTHKPAMGFPTILQSLTGHSRYAARKALVAQELSRPDGLTGPMPHAELDIKTSLIVIKPIHNPFGGEIEKTADADELVSRIDNEFRADRAVALLSPSADGGEDNYHWVLLTGTYKVDGRLGSIHIIDPLDRQKRPFPFYNKENKREAAQYGRVGLLTLIERSMPQDLYACSFEITQNA